MSESYLPQTSADIDAQTDFSALENPGYTYRIDFEKSRISGKTDKREALSQTIRLILGPERYKYPIYSENYSG